MNRSLALTALVTVAATLLATSVHAAPAADGFRIRYAERLAGSAKPAADGTWQFSAQGKTWSARLAPNTTLLALVKSQAASLRLPAVWKGQLDGLPGSWVRLTAGTTGTWGTVWDGSDLYFIEPAADAAPFLIDGASTQGSVVYRASDTQLDPTVKLCPVVALPEPASRLAAAAGINTALRTAPATKTGLDSYRALMAEMAPPTAAATLTGRLRVSLVADFEYQQRFGTTGATDRMVARFNTIDGFFSAQVGVQVQVASVRLFDVVDDPFTSTDAGTALTEIANWRANAAQAAVRADSGITHLVTGKNLDGTTVGIAYLGALCSNNFGASLSEGDSDVRSNLTSTLIAAHELGHNFGAPHDGEASTSGAANPCESVARTFLMAPQLNGSSTFSQCSLDQIAPEVAASRCILAPVVVDPTPTIDLVGTLTSPATSAGLRVSALSTADFSVRNAGNAEATNVSVVLEVGAGLQTNGTATLATATCTTDLLRVTCTLPRVAAGATVAGSVGLQGVSTGSSTLRLTATATEPDGTPVDTTVNISVSAANPPDPPPTPASGGGGGGGAMDPLALSALGLVALLAMAGRRGAPRRVRVPSRAPRAARGRRED